VLDVNKHLVRLGIFRLPLKDAPVSCHYQKKDETGDQEPAQIRFEKVVRLHLVQPLSGGHSKHHESYPYPQPERRRR
jgi:hypothetical protein